MHEYLKLFTPSQKNLVISWMVSSVCNYNCSYCIPYLNDGFFKFPDSYTHILNFLKQVQHKNPEKVIHIMLSGGEPTLWKLLPDFSKKCVELGIAVHINSNGSMGSGWWRENAENFASTTISFHREFSTKSHITKVVETVTKLKLSDILTVLLLMPLEHFYDNYEFGKELVKNNDNLGVIFRPVRTNISSDIFLDYTDEQYKIMAKYIYSKKKLCAEPWLPKKLMAEYKDGVLKNIFRNEIVLEKENSWKDWLCNAGIETLLIEFDGSVYVCTRKIGGSIGNLSDSIVLPTEPVICPEDYCWCAQDIGCTKRKE